MVLLVSLLAVVGFLLLVWLLSIPLRDASIVDIAWGPAFVVIAWVALAVGDGADGRSVLLAGLVTVWGVRLGAYLARRNLGHGEDRRYVAMRRAHPNFVLWSLGGVFLLQAVLAWIVSLPVQLAMGDASPAAVGWLGWLGIAVWVVGFSFESIGDLQLARFKASPDSDGQVMDRGLWRYTRHPNYFGDCLVWWGIFLVAAETGTAWWGIVGPIVMTVLLTRVSGKDLLEKTIGKRRPGYAEYVERTSGFFPLRPRASPPVG